MANLGTAAQSAVSGSQSGAAAGSSLGGWGALIGGLLGGAGGLAGGLLSSGGTSAADQLHMMETYYQPTKAGWSWAQLENQVALEQFRKQLASSAQADLALSKAMNMELPSAQVAGLKAAGINPILAVLGSGFSPIQSSAAASMSGGARLPGGLSRPARRVNSAGSAMDLARIIGGAVDAELDNRKADTANKRALTDNVRTSNDLVRAQADKTSAEADLIRDKVEHGSSWMSDYGREIRNGLKKLGDVVDLFPAWFESMYENTHKPVKEPNGSSAKRPGVIINLEPKPSKKELPSIHDTYIPF